MCRGGQVTQCGCKHFHDYPVLTQESLGEVVSILAAFQCSIHAHQFCGFLASEFPSTAAFIYIRQANVHLNTPGITKSCYCILAKTETSRTSNSSQHGTGTGGRTEPANPTNGEPQLLPAAPSRVMCRGFRALGSSSINLEQVPSRESAGGSNTWGAPAQTASRSQHGTRGSKQTGTGKPIKCHQELNAKSRAQKPGNSPTAFVMAGERSQVVFLPVFLILLKAVRSFLQILSPSPNLLKHKIELSIFRTLIGFIQWLLNWAASQLANKKELWGLGSLIGRNWGGSRKRQIVSATTFPLGEERVYIRQLTSLTLTRKFRLTS